MVKSFLFSVTLILICGIAVAQKSATYTMATLPPLTLAQMYHDYDVLVETLQQISPQHEFRKKITGIEINDFYRKTRLRLPSIKTREAFYNLVRSIVTANQDSHTSVLRSTYMPRAIFKQFGVSDSAICWNDTYTQYYNTIANGNKLNFQFSYINGVYYNIIPFTYQGRYYKAGLEITKCNGLPINTYVNSLYPYLVMKWDFINHTYFSDTFFKSFNLSPGDHLTLDFKDDARSHTFLVGDSAMLDNKVTSIAPKVKKFIWFADQKILYIRMPEMNTDDSDYYAKEVLKYRDYKIDKVVIDIRDNPGGGDGVWRNLLSNMISKPIIFPEIVLANHNDRVIKLLAPQFKPGKVIEVPFLGNVKFYADDEGIDTIPVANTSIKFAGKTFVLQNKNVYSSAGSLLAAANLVPDFYTVGVPTGTQLGIGVNPLIFELPYSKIVFRIEPIIDYSNVKVPGDIFHNHVKVPVNLTFKNLQDMLNATDRYSQSFLLNSDPLFKRVLEF